MSKKPIKVISCFKQLVEVLDVKGGWTTVRHIDEPHTGETGKVRNGALRDPTEDELKALNAKPPKPKKAPKPTDVPPPEAKPKKVKPPKIPKPKKVLTPEEQAEIEARRVVNPDYTRYTKHNIKSPSGRKALDINDEAAGLLRGQDISDCYFITAKNMAKHLGGDPDQIEADLKKNYAHLNIGMQRMNLGNRLRKAMGTYGNLNAHKGVKTADSHLAGTQEHHDYEASNGIEASVLKYGRRAGDALKRASDQKLAAA